MAYRSLTLTTDAGLPLDGVESGDPRGTPLVLVHGLTDSWRAFVPLMDRLPQDRRVIAVSLRGHGDSGKPLDGYTIASLADDLASALALVGIGRAVWLGHSLGSLVVQRLTAMRPDMVAALVLIAPFVAPSNIEALAALWRDAFSTLAEPLDPQFVRDWQESSCSPEVDSRFLDAVIAESHKAPAHVWRQTFDAMRQTDLSPSLGAIVAPVLLITGTRDETCTHEAARAATELRNARHLHFGGTGHAPHWESAEQVARAIARFLEEVPA